MSFGTSQVVGVIELDRPTPNQYEHPLSPSAHFLTASDGDEVITADVRQLHRELRAELSFVLARLKKSLHVNSR
jgi:hypothetical protein